MLNLINKILSDNAIAAAAITSIVALIGIIIGAINYIYQNSQKNKIEYQKMLKEKLECFYAPLYLKYSTDLNYAITRDEDMMPRITKYNYLIDLNTQKLLTKIIEIENQATGIATYIPGTNNLQSEKLKKHKEALLKYISQEYFILSSCYKKVYKDIDLRYRNNNTNIFSMIIKMIKMLTAVFILFFLSLLAYVYLVGKGSSLVLKEIILPVVIIICFYGVLIYVADLISIIWGHIRRTLHYYIPNESVPAEGEYACVYCNKKEYFYNNTIFTACSNSKNHKPFFKSSSRWKKA